MRKTAIVRVLTGIHGAGKTAVGLRLQNLGFDFYPEIAIDLLERRLPWELPLSFDREVFQRETERDAILRRKRRPIFVETWHVGNLAHAVVRHRDRAEDFWSLTRQALKAFRPRVFLLEAPVETMRQRSAYFESPEELDRASEFFSLVGRELLTVMKEFQLDAVKIDSTQELDLVVRQVLQNNNE